MAASAPPTYEEAIGSSTGPPAGPPDGPSAGGPSTTTSTRPTHRTRNGIPPAQRRSMEDEARPLPKGWVRTFDPATSHQFFVDVTADPPRSIWHHPYDDEEYVAGLPDEQRKRLAGQGALLGHSVSREDLAAESTDEDDDRSDLGRGGHDGGGDDDHPPGALSKLGRKLKDRITSSTHAEREAERQRRAAEEEDAYRQHLAFRRGLTEVVRTGRPQLIGRDDDGREVYLEPPGVAHRGVVGERRLSSYITEVEYASGAGPGVGGPGARYIRADGMYPGGLYNGGYGGGYGGLGYGGGLARPYGPYNRPYGLGYGGGFGMPLAAPLLGGMMLGGLMF
ncbi:hypothetical protein QBC33DRAFT_459607 [Phialemonium atrogriseum]|uniref:WW domain-containing protein n=1 Tax=Phialemonium atrogriseum TaxID=1093897 RepID=A0AAJ0BRY9_9PEZI|nr:uncharacterized protein QBC33DRAFT_459607 [Phialemonium atrogriseum]KAK1763403.1 hypothetical protein QBC33DRAFT_459607 [Phialemonium atrogriseum]